MNSLACLWFDLIHFCFPTNTPTYSKQSSVTLLSLRSIVHLSPAVKFANRLTMAISPRRWSPPFQVEAASAACIPNRLTVWDFLAVANFHERAAPCCFMLAVITAWNFPCCFMLAVITAWKIPCCSMLFHAVGINLRASATEWCAHAEHDWRAHYGDCSPV